MRSLLVKVIFVACWLATCVGYAQNLNKNDLAIVAYGSQGVDLSAQDVELVRKATNTCAFFEEEHASPAVIDAVESILLHASEDPRFQETCLTAIYDRIGIDVDAEGYAELADAVALSHHKDQDFGSFWKLQNASLVPVDKNPGADTSRSRIGLPPLDVRVKRMDEALSSGQIPLLWERPLALIKPS